MKPTENNEPINDATDAGAPQAQTTRRDFLKVATTTAAGFAAANILGTGAGTGTEREAEAHAAAVKMAGKIPVPVADTKKMMGGAFPKGPVMASGRARGANDRIGVAFAGVGGMGGAHVHHYSDEHAERNVELLGFCDAQKGRAEGNRQYAVDKGAAKVTAYAGADYRTLLDNPDIDAIVIATPEHWHAQIACHAMEAGKHVYIQKPMTRYIDEAFQVHDTAVRTKRVVQVGSQGCSNMVYHAAGKAIRDGKIGQMVMGQGSYTRNSQKGEWNYGIDGNWNADNLAWDVWLGSAPPRPWNNAAPGSKDGDDPARDDAKSRFARYRKYRDYSAGILGDLAPHKLHPFLIASGTPEYPVRVSCVGTQLDSNREVEDTIQVVAEFPSKWTMLFVGSTVNEQGMQDMFRGHKATIYFANGVKIEPERWASEEVTGEQLAIDGPTFESHENHEKDWLLCIRTGKTPNCNIDLATKVQTIISLAEMSLRLSKTAVFDPKTRKITMG